VVPLDGEAREYREATPLDDDGFESLNGNGSSENGEEAIEDAEEARRMQSNISEDLSTQNRSSLNWKSSAQDVGSFSVTVDTHIERNRSALNYNGQQSERSLPCTKLSTSKVAVPLVQITQHKDILRFPDEQELTVESVAHAGCLKNDSCSDEAARILDPIKCNETKCKVPKQTGNDNTQKLLGVQSGECDHESSQRKELINEEEHKRLSDSSAEERPAPFRNFWMQDIISCRSPSPDTNHADSDTDITDMEIRSKSPQVMFMFLVLIGVTVVQNILFIQTESFISLLSLCRNNSYS